MVIKNWLDRYLFPLKILFFTYFIFLTWLLLKPGSDEPMHFDPFFFIKEYKDKVAHFVSFAILSFLFSIAFPKVKCIINILIFLIFGIFIEFAQMIMNFGRDAEFLDVVFDLIGLVIGIIILKLFHIICNAVFYRKIS